MHERAFCSHREVPTDAFSPRALTCSIFTQGMQFPQGHKLNPRDVYDYEIELFLDGSGSIIVDGKEYPVRKGDIMLRRPGQRAQGIMPYSCYIICFDLLGNTGKRPETYSFDKQQEFQADYRNPVLDAIPLSFHTALFEKHLGLFDMAFRGFIEAEPGSEMVTKAAILQILYHIHREIRDPFSEKNLAASPHAAVIKKVLHHIQENFTSDINLGMLARVSSLSPTYFHKIFTETVGVTPNEYITQQRMNSARELLLGTSLSVGKVAAACGYDNIPYFSHLFKTRYGTPPGEFRRRSSFT